ncbi:hypothetical protein BC830DRAFT_1114418 [Chytriomyces sp. MP71]|nr:hypothetical protein BC830DRAFT_1114418 [Chytriomyces sp. MP71]
MSTYANGGDPRRQPHQQPMTAASTGYIPYGQHVNYGQHSHTVPYGSNGYPPPAPGSAGSAVNGSTGIGGQPMPGVQHGYSLQQQQQQQQQLYAMQQIHYAQMMAQQQHHQPPPSMVFNAQVHVPVPVGYPQYSLPPHLQSQQQYARPVAPSAPMTQAPSPTQRVLSPSSSAASSNSSRQPQPQPHQHLRPPPSQTVASKLASRRSPSVQSMAASARARDDDDNASIASTSSSKSFSGFITGVKRGFMKGIGLRSESQRVSSFDFRSTWPLELRSCGST